MPISSTPIAHEVADAAVVGPFLCRVEIAGRQLVVAAMVGDTFAADAITRTARIGAVTIACVLFLIHTIHEVS